MKILEHGKSAVIWNLPEIYSTFCSIKSNVIEVYLNYFFYTEGIVGKVVGRCSERKWFLEVLQSGWIRNIKDLKVVT